MRYGHFDDARREYVISRPDTPLPWINYLGSEPRPSCHCEPRRGEAIPNCLNGWT
ncbi:MAG: hypothetical protein M8467_07025 [Anaerolineae bacterium]|nr:hypothetical protein [Anaerolineae bacterium]